MFCPVSPGYSSCHIPRGWGALPFRFENRFSHEVERGALLPRPLCIQCTFTSARMYRIVCNKHILPALSLILFPPVRNRHLLLRDSGESFMRYCSMLHINICSLPKSAITSPKKTVFLQLMASLSSPQICILWSVHFMKPRLLSPRPDITPLSFSLLLV